MKSRLQTAARLCVVLVLAGVSQAQAADSAATKGTPIAEVIAGTAKKNGKKFIVDPRVQGDVTVVGLDPDGLDYSTLLSVLQIHGFAAIDDGKYVRVIPDGGIRSVALPLVTGDESHPSAEYVTRVIAVKNVPAAQLVPLLRSLLPQQAHLIALPCRNTLMVVDTFANVKRIERLVAALDTGEAYTPEKCAVKQVAKAE